MGVKILSTHLQNAIELQWWVLVDVDVREASLLCDCEVLLWGVHCNRADAVSVLTNENFFFMRVYIVYLIGVASCEDNNVIFKMVNIEPLHGCHSVAPEELMIALGNGWIWENFLLMALGIELIDPHYLLLGQYRLVEHWLVYLRLLITRLLRLTY
jgi:hypothetical protein